MKLQYMIIIFAIIIIPITLLLTLYIQSQTDSIALQTKYDTMLLDATYDAVVAFDSNTLNNENSNNKDTLRESIAASINTFVNSLSNNLGVGGYSKEYLMPYVPAMAYTMYDGFYIYSPINNLETKVNPDGLTYISGLNYEHVLKPYIYYSEILDNGYIINYSLDNYITIYGNENDDVIVKSGYLLDTSKVEITGETVKYNGKNIENEVLKENISIIRDDDATNTPDIIENCQYFYNVDHEKIYKDNFGFFKVKDYRKQYRTGVFQKIINASGEIEVKEIKNVDFPNDSFPLDQSAKVYYVEAKKFTDEINSITGMPDYLKISSTNNPEDESSAFVQHKREVIKTCIEENLNNAINSYNSQSGKEYNFKMPKITEKDWEQVFRNVSVISFFQGIPVGLRTYNNYAVVTSTGNKEYIDPSSIYLIGEDEICHKKDCKMLTGGNLIGYPKYDFNQYRKNYNSSEVYFKHSKENGEGYIQSCYYCIVDSVNPQNSDIPEGSSDDNVRNKAYYTALARERYNLIKTTQNLK